MTDADAWELLGEDDPLLTGNFGPAPGKAEQQRMIEEVRKMMAPEARDE